MKQLLFFFLVVLLAGCSNPLGYAVKGLSRKVEKCCTALTPDNNNHAPVPETAEPAPFPAAVFEEANQIVPTW